MPPLFRRTSRMKTMRLCSIALLFLTTLLCAVLSLAQTPATASTQKIAIRAGRMLDVRTGNVVNNAVILIENGRITDAGAGVSIPAGAHVIDLHNSMVLPGLVDCHTHLLQNYDGSVGGDDPN